MLIHRNTLPSNIFHMYALVQLVKRNPKGN